MYEKIVQKLKEQRGTTSNVSDRSLEDLAKSLETVITTDEILAVADLTKAIESLDGNISYYASGAVKKAKDIEEAEKANEATKLAAKKAAEKVKKEAGKKDDTPDWAKALFEGVDELREQNKTHSANLLALKNEKVTSTRSDKLNTIIKDLPDYVKDPIKEGFKTASFTNDEAFSTYLQQVEKSRKTFEQAAKEQGLNTNVPTVIVQKPVDTGETSEIADARKLVNKNKKENATNTNNK